MAFHNSEKRVVRLDESERVPSCEARHSPRRWSWLPWLALLAIASLLFVHADTKLCQRLALRLYGQATDGQMDAGRDGPPATQAGLHAAAQAAPAMKRDDAATASSDASRPTVLVNFQVAQPVLMPYGAADSDGSSDAGQKNGSPSRESCTATLMDYSFGNSYGKPFVGSYDPPNCEFNRVVMNFTVVSQGLQFDRLALMYFGDTEVWRTSTAEPTNPPGIRWVYLKDMTEYMYFWKSSQKLIFDLGNVIDDTYTGLLNATLTATFFQSDVPSDTAPPSDLIIPISARRSSNGSASVFMVPQVNATDTVSFPRNANRAVFSVSACGQANEEFWWSDVLQSDILAFNSTTGPLLGHSPFREVQVLIDGQMAGVQWPFPVIFTGGVVPGLHRPIAGVDSYDLKEHEIDITPFLPLLCDGQQHTFSIRVAGIDDNGDSSGRMTETIEQNWYVTGKIFVWLDDEDSVTTGDMPVVDMSAPTITLSQSMTKASNGSNQTLTYDTAVSRSLHINAKVRTQQRTETYSWSQTLSYSNKGYLSNSGFNQINDFVITGTDQAGGPVAFRADYKYPLYANTTYTVSPQGNVSLWAHVVQGKELQVSGATVFPTGLEAFGGGVAATRDKRFAGVMLSTTQEGTASFLQAGDKKNSASFGTTNQVFHFGGVTNAGALGDTPDVELYYRNVTAVNSTVTYDRSVLAGATLLDKQDVVVPEYDAYGDNEVQIPLSGGSGPRAFLGRAGNPGT